MIYRSKAPLRLGFAGGGTDVSPFCDLHGGLILNACINMHAYATIELLEDQIIELHAIDKKEILRFPMSEVLPINGQLDLLKGVYNHLRVAYPESHWRGFKLSTYVDAEAGSGLGSSSTLVVAIIGAFMEWLKLPLGEYDIANMAYYIERSELGMAGGRQDQYAAAFGGFNFMEFYEGDKVIVNPLRIKQPVVAELENNLLLYYTGTSRLSSRIIEAQSKNIAGKKDSSLDAMFQLKEQAKQMKESILKGRLSEMGRILDFGWKHKKRTADGITNPLIDEIYEEAIASGATGGKISGAGGGGYMFFFCPANTRFTVAERIQQFGGQIRKVTFSQEGLTTWTYTEK